MKARLYLIVTGDFVTTGGMDRANHALASYLALCGEEVHLVAHRVASDLLAYPNVHFHRVPKPAGSYLLGEPLLDRVGRFWAKRVAARGGRVIVNGGNCQWGDVNWVHYVHAAYAPRVTGGLLRRLKAGWSHRTFLAAERKALRQARVVIANSRRTEYDATEKVGVAPDRVRVVYYGTDTSDFRPATPEERSNARSELGWSTDRQVVGFVGALGDRRKGFDTLFDAWVALCNGSGWDADLVVVGAGTELPAWRARAAALGIAAHVRFLGLRRDVPRILAACDLLVSPTRYEAYGLGVHEALCCGIPVIVTSDAGVAECVPPGMGDLLLRDPDDAVELRGLITRWRLDCDRYRALARSASATFRCRTFDGMAEEILTRI